MAEPILVAYWLDKEITNTFPCPPLRAMGDLKNGSTGKPQISVVCIMCASFLGTQQNFTAPYIGISPSTQQAFDNGDVKYLQQQGIKVVLTVMSNDSIGWSSVPASENAAFASWTKTFIDQYGLDGIDVDDENFNSGMSVPASLLPTLSALRQQMPKGKYLFTKALWQDTNCFDYKMSDGTTLPDLIDFGSSMTYGNSLEELQSTASVYTVTGDDGVQYPLGTARVCVGVQPGPMQSTCGGPANFTSLPIASAAAYWAKNSGYMGMMLYSYSQDVIAFTTCPQHGQYPSPLDHAWQKAIAVELFSNAI